MAAPTLQLRAPALPASLDEIQDLVQELWSRHAWVPVTDRIRFETVVAEIAGNIIQHAVPADGAEVVTMDFSAAGDPAFLQATFLDDGRQASVDLGEVGMPDAGSEDGRGLALAVAMSDGLGYAREGRLNRWTIIVRSNPRPG